MWWTRIVFVAPGVVGGVPATMIDEVAGMADAALNKRRVDLAHHVVGRLHRPHQVRLGAPQQRESAAARSRPA